jgi:hypothetical protein
MITYSSYTRESDSLIELLRSEDKIGVYFSQQPCNNERVWIQETQEFESVSNFLRDDYINPWVEEFDLTMLVRLALDCWDAKLPNAARPIKSLCIHRSGAYGIQPDSPLIGVWNLYLNSNEPIIELITTSSDPALQPKVLLEQAELLLDWHYRRIQRLNRQFGGDPRSRTDTAWFQSHQSLARPKRKSKSSNPNKAFDRDFVPLMLAAKIVMHFHPRSSLLQALALAPIYYAVGEWGYEYWFRRSLQRHCANQQGWLFLLMNMPKFEPEELMYLMSRMSIAAHECECIIESINEYFDEERDIDWVSEKEEYMELFEELFLRGNLLNY